MSESARGKATSGKSGTDNNSTECPTCGRTDFKSLKGLRQHHTRSHGESIAKVELECDGCGEIYKRWKSQLDESENGYCSPECYHEHYEQASGLESPQTKAVEYECDYCGGVCLKRPSRLGRADNLYCSRECADLDHSERMRLDGNPRWEGGDYENYYGDNWQEQRQQALSRDNHKCQSCGVESSGATLSVHHIRKMRYYKDEYDAPEWWKRANKLSNLVTLCRSCHGRWEGIPLKPQLR